MLDQPVSESHIPAPPRLPEAARIRAWLARTGASLLARLLGTADGPAVAVVANRELSLIFRSWEWQRFIGTWLLFCAAVLITPLLVRAQTGEWRNPGGEGWFLLGGYTLQGASAAAMSQWCIRRLRRDLHSHRLDELMLTRCSPADIATGEALASAFASLWLVAAAFPVCLFLSAIAGHGFGAAARLALSLPPAAALGVWFGMGWGLAFTLRRSAAVVPLTQWWVMGPFIPLWIGWSLLGAFPIIWAVLGFFPGGNQAVKDAVSLLARVGQQLVQNWNPFLLVGAAVGLWKSVWFTDWLALLLIMLFMMRKSMDAVHLALGSLGEQNSRSADPDRWIHHDIHYFTQYGKDRRRQPEYRDGGSAIAAFDAALGHRVYLHPVFWTLALMIYLFLLGWSLLVPALGKYTGIAAVLTPATAALLLMSGGVAVSFGWERDQHRWPALAVLPIDNIRLALGKIKGVVRPTLWMGLLAGATALLLGWRGALDFHASLWMALHVLVFPVALAFVSATLALTTPTLGEALLRWAVLGAIPTLATVLPPPIGGASGVALPFTPPLLVLILVLNGPTPDLLRAAWTALGLEVFGIAASLIILKLFLRRWTVGEKD
jgi:hypothetical protein